jgi:hypothetical protein
MWEPRRLTTLWASTACYRDSFLNIFRWCRQMDRTHRAIFFFFVQQWIRPCDLFPYRMNLTCIRCDSLDTRPARSKAATCTGQRAHRRNASSGILTHYPNVWADEDISYLWPQAHYDIITMQSVILLRWNFCLWRGSDKKKLVASSLWTHFI